MAKSIDSLMNKVSIKTKAIVMISLLLLCLSVLLVQALMSYASAGNKAALEQQGLAVLGKLSAAQSALAKTRLAVVSGGADAQAQGLAMGKAVDELAAGLAGAQLGGGQASLAAQSGKLKAAWTVAREQTLAGDKTALQSLDAVAAALQDTTREVARSSGVLADGAVVGGDLAQLSVILLPQTQSALTELSVLAVNGKGGWSEVQKFSALQQTGLVQSQLKTLGTVVAGLGSEGEFQAKTVSDPFKQVQASQEMLVAAIAVATGAGSDVALVQVRQSAEQLEGALASMALAARNGLTALVQQRASAIVWGRNGTLLMCFVLVGGALFTAFAALSSLTRSVTALLKYTQALASGDLTAKPKFIPNDEVGVIMKSVGGVADNLSNVLHDLKEAASSMIAMSSDMTNASSEVENAAESSSMAAAGMARAVEGMTMSIGVVFNNASQALQLAKSAGEAAQSGRSLAEESAHDLSSVSQSTHELTDMINHLNNSAMRISGVVKVIQDVAQQTNLLALNAAIEAARAGEAGRGFSVVADEVRKLAENTSKSTYEIREVIVEIQSTTSSAVEKVHGWAEVVSQSVDKALGNSQGMESISQVSAEAVDSVQTIYNSVCEQAESSNMLAQSVEKITSATGVNSDMVKQVKDRAHELDEVAQRISHLGDRFKVA
jgi:methyl-accepting chemotaxis protein